MPAISFKCPECKESLEAPSEYAGEIVACPECQAEITVPESAAPTGRPRDEEEPEGADAADAEGADDDVENEEHVCPECGADMEPEAVLCLGCGYHVRLGHRIETEINDEDDDR